MKKRILISLLVLIVLLSLAGLIVTSAAKPLWEADNVRNKIVVISDIHLGIDDTFSENVENKAVLIKFLQRLQKTKDVQELVINGDFLDDWYLPLSYPTYSDTADFYQKVIANNKKIFKELNNVMASGINLVYIPGNHDMLLESGILDEALPGIVQARDSQGLGTYYTGGRNEIAIEHGHRYDVFSAPDAITNKDLNNGNETILPPGYFYARIATSWVTQGRPSVEKDLQLIADVPDPRTNLDQYGAYLYHAILSSELTRITPQESYSDNVFDMHIDGYNGNYSVNDLLPVVLDNGNISAPVLFKDFQRTWQERQEVNLVKVKNEFAEAVAGTLDSNYYFEQAKMQYLTNPNEKIEIVLFGHTHIPMVKTLESGKCYINEGTWIDHNADDPITRTFAVVTTGKSTSTAGLYEYQADGTVVDITASRSSSEKSEIKEMVSAMSVEEKIGQVLLMNFRSWGKDKDGNPIPLEECNETVKEIIAKYHLANIIVFGENTKNTEKTVRFIDDLQQASINSGGMPLLIGIDQEGGIVTRLGQGTCLPGNMAIGASGKTENAYLTGKVIGEELAAIGVNCDFAPVCDVNDNPDNPVIHLRSFSNKAEVVKDMAISMRKGLSENDIISSAKHFPGHGNTAVDTHVGLAVVEKTKEEWLNLEAVPFKAMIADGVDMIMTAHVQFPNLDDTKYCSKLSGKDVYLPATLSHKILTEILRGELGFQGVIVTDAMDMKAITDNYGEQEACVMALNAGADLLCNPTAITSEAEIENLDKVYDEIKKSLTDGHLTMQRLDEAVERILMMKQKYGLLEVQSTSSTVDEKVTSALAVVGSSQHRETERQLANDAITLYSTDEYTPFTVKENEKILFAVPYANKANSAIYAINRLIREKSIPNVNVETFLYDKQEEISPDLASQIDSADHIIIVSQLGASDLNNPDAVANVMPPLIADAVEAAGKNDKCAVISIGIPNDVTRFAKLPVYAAYGYQGMGEEDAKTGTLTEKYGPNLPAAVDSIMGVFSPIIATAK